MLLITLVTGAVVAIGPIFRRFTQGMIRLVADQVGNQQGSDQQDVKAGFLINSYTTSKMISQGVREDFLGNTTYYPYSISMTDLNQYSNLGYSPGD